MRIFFVLLFFQTSLLLSPGTCLAQSLAGQWDLQKLMYSETRYRIDLNNKDVKKEMLEFYMTQQKGNDHRISKKNAKEGIDKLIASLEGCTLMLSEDHVFTMANHEYVLTVAIPGMHMDTLGGTWSNSSDSLTLTVDILEEFKISWQFEILELSEHHMKLKGISKRADSTTINEMDFNSELEFTR